MGAANYITKPFLRGELLAGVDRILKPENKLKGLQALIADDSRAVRIFVSEALENEGITVIEACDGQEALEIISRKLQEIDLVVTAMVMPHISGKDLCRKIRVDLNHQGIPILVMSALADKVDVLELFKEGATDYLSKPFPKEELLARINVHLQVRLLDRQLGRNVQQLKTLGKMKDDFLAICSHDLRSPLASIKGFAGLLRSGTVDQEESLDFSQRIESSADFLLTMVTELLDLVKLQTENEDLEMKLLNISDILKISKTSMEQMLSLKNLSLVLEDKTTPDMKVSGNASALTRIVNNLLSNAIKFTPKDGTIGLTLEPDQNGNIIFSIADCGIGIAKERIPLLFQKFSKVSRKGTEGETGTGLGLSIVKELVEKHQGTIEVDSEEGQGTTSRVQFPRSR